MHGVLITSYLAHLMSAVCIHYKIVFCEYQLVKYPVGICLNLLTLNRHPKQIHIKSDYTLLMEIKCILRYLFLICDGEKLIEWEIVRFLLINVIK